MLWLLVAVVVLLGLMWLELRSIRKTLEKMQSLQTSSFFDRRQKHDEQQQMLFDIKRNTDDIRLNTHDLPLLKP